jgi:hypothetical protein
MRRAILALSAGLALLLTLSEPAAAQMSGPFLQPRSGGLPQTPFSTSPVVSPYLDIVRGGNPAINWYLGTLPEFDRRNFQNTLLAALPGLEGYGNQPAGIAQNFEIPTLPQTGHLAGFQSFGSFYSFGSNQVRPFYPLNPNQMRPLPR